MIKIVFVEREVRVAGHADFRKRDSDEVCAAISALVQALAAYTRQLDFSDGFACLRLGQACDAEKMAIAAFLDLSYSYPQHVQVTHNESFCYRDFVQCWYARHKTKAPRRTNLSTVNT